MLLVDPLLIWGRLTDPKNEYGLCKRPKTKRELEKPKGHKRSDESNFETRWFDIIAGWIPSEHSDQQPNAVLTVL